jgi:hypothetical protein
MRALLLRLRSSVSSGLSLGLLIGCVAALTPACPTNTCNASNCVTGCCDSGGRCQLPSSNACGLNGNVCQQCVLGQNCSAGVCTGGTSGTGGFGQGGGFSGVGGGASGVGGGFSGVGGGSSGSSYSAFLTSFASAYCQYLIRCGQVTTSGLSACNEYVRLQVGSLGLPSERSVAIGASSFDATAAATCLTDLGNLACNTSPPRSCYSGVGTPLAMLNGVCDSARDCVGGMLSCNGASCMKRCTEGGNLGEGCKTGSLCNAPFACIDGTCINEPAPGTPCQFSGDCGSTMQCRNRVCERLATVGASCATISCVPQAYCDFSTRVCRTKLTTGAVCSSSSQCETLRCVGSRCETLGSPGASCQGDFDCQTGLSCFCQTGPGCFSGQCRSKGQVGARCFRSSDCLSTLDCDDVSLTCRDSMGVVTGQPCSGTQFCSGANDTCRNKVVVQDGGTGLPGTCGPAQVGDSCLSSFSCGTARYCDPATSRCAAAANGTPCGSSSNCLPAQYCTSSDVCAAKAPAGQVCDSMNRESCSAPGERCLGTSTPGQSRCQQVPEVGSPCINECVFGAVCSGGLCVASGRVGQPCFRGTECFSGVCQSDGGLDRRCEAPVANGTPCGRNTECQSGSCDRGLCVAACP